MKCLVTGVAGFIGSHLAEQLITLGHSVIGIDCFTDYYSIELKKNNLKNLLNRNNFTFYNLNIVKDSILEIIDGIEWVFHNAAQPGVRKSWGNDFNIYTENNILGTQKLLEAFKGSKTLKKFVYASSSSIYGNPNTLPTNEEINPSPLSPYGVSKLAAEHLCNLYYKNFNIPTISLRYFTVYGPRQRPDMAFHIFIKDLIEDREIKVFGDGKQTRDFTYIDDIVNSNILAANSSSNGEVFNIGGGTYISLLEVIEILENLLNKKAKIQFLSSAKGDVTHTYADINKAKKILGYNPSTPIYDGLKKQVEWEQTIYTKI